MLLGYFSFFYFCFGCIWQSGACHRTHVEVRGQPACKSQFCPPIKWLSDLAGSTVTSWNISLTPFLFLTLGLWSSVHTCEFIAFLTLRKFPVTIQQTYLFLPPCAHFFSPQPKQAHVCLYHSPLTFLPFSVIFLSFPDILLCLSSHNSLLLQCLLCVV